MSSQDCRYPAPRGSETVVDGCAFHPSGQDLLALAALSSEGVMPFGGPLTSASFPPLMVMQGREARQATLDEEFPRARPAAIR